MMRATSPAAHPPARATGAAAVPARSRVPWLLLVCDDSELAISAARRSRFYGICVNHVSQASVARNIVQRYPFAAIALAGSFASGGDSLLRELRETAPRVPIVVVGAARADAHRALLRAGADRILPPGVEPERLIAVCAEIIHEGQPTIGTVLAIAEDPATLGVIERRLIDLGCNVVSVPSMTSLEETVDVVQPDLLLAEMGAPMESQLALLERLRLKPELRQMPVVAIAAHAAMAHQLVGHKELVDEVVLKRTLGDQIRATVLHLMRRKHGESIVDLDVSTGALGHEAFLALGARTLAQADVRGTRLGLASIEVNTDELAKRIGHGAADLMLKAIYHRIRDTFDAATVTIGRLDNGCFALIAEDEDVVSLRGRLHSCIGAFTPSVRINVGAVAYDGDSSFKQLLAGSMRDASEPSRDVDVRASAGAAAQPVYIVEDDDVLRTLLTEQLSRAGFQCRGYGNGSEALDALLDEARADERPVVLLDLDIPGLDGLSLLERLRHGRPDVYRTVIMTADETERSELEGLRAGAHDYVVKPVKIPVMVERIRRLMA
jgi:DNA-binding response OmpR family regulator